MSERRDEAWIASSPAPRDDGLGLSVRLGALDALGEALPQLPELGRDHCQAIGIALAFAGPIILVIILRRPPARRRLDGGDDRRRPVGPSALDRFAGGRLL